ncbi:hypothetical protein HPB51_016076 [Rhipicephalus microplus]|uniref:Uncharacterized protein n=1 Tax=Rhipicephalus microplus TaxID=6941 RepID=A0A9J6DIC7_RHIMP|nr:hypothetical protein HPB51_016076 [Rhipicephalus microplus]
MSIARGAKSGSVQIAETGAPASHGNNCHASRLAFNCVEDAAVTAANPLCAALSPYGIEEVATAKALVHVYLKVHMRASVLTVGSLVSRSTLSLDLSRCVGRRKKDPVSPSLLDEKEGTNENSLSAAAVQCYVPAPENHAVRSSSVSRCSPFIHKRQASRDGRCGGAAAMDVLITRILLPTLIANVLCATLAVLASTPIVPSTLPPFATADLRSGNNGTPTEASGPQEGVTHFNSTSASYANATSIPEEGERVLNHLMRLMETLNHVPYLEALSRGSLHGKDEMPVINEAVKKLEVGAHDNATLSVTLYESPKEGGEALPTMQKEFIFVHPSVNTSQDLASEAGNLHGYISPHVPHNVGGHESQGYRYGQWAAGGRSQKHEQHGRLSTGGAHRHLENAHGKVHKERAHDKGGQAERKYRVRTEIEYFEREKFKDDEHDKLKAAHRSKASTDAIKGADRFASQGHQSHQRHLGGGYAQGTQHAVGAGYAPVYVHGAPASGGNKGIDGGSSGFSQKDAQNHEEYHHEAGSQGFTDKDKGHQRAGWRERGYRIIAEKEYVDKDKHHDKAYGVDNQEQGHRLRTQGQHGHKQGHDDVKKAKEHYSHGVHDSAHHEKAHKNRAAYGNNYHVDGSTVDPTSTRDHLYSSTSKVAELEAGNATNSPDDTARRKKIIRIRVLSKTPGTTSVMIGGHATKVPPESGSPAGDTEESTTLVSPPKATSQIDSFGRTYGGVAVGPALNSVQTPNKHFVPMEVLASLYSNIRGDTPANIPREKHDLNNQPPYFAQVHRPVSHKQSVGNSRQLYNENSFQPIVENPGLRDESRENRNPSYGTQTHSPPSIIDVAGPTLHHSP